MGLGICKAIGKVAGKALRPVGKAVGNVAERAIEGAEWVADRPAVKKAAHAIAEGAEDVAHVIEEGVEFAWDHGGEDVFEMHEEAAKGFIKGIKDA